MKKIFWTSIVWIALLVLAIAYVKFFDKPLASSIGTWLSHKTELQIISTWSIENETEINSKLVELKDKLDNILIKLWSGDQVTLTGNKVK